MSTNKFGEIELAQIHTDTQVYFINRDRAGLHVLRVGNTNGKELFSKIRDDGKKNTKKERVANVSLLEKLIE